MDISNADKLIKKLPDYFLADNSEGINSAISLTLSGEMNQTWTIRIKNKTCIIENGKDQNAALALAASPENLTEIISGKLDPARAFMQGKIKFSGNMNLAFRFAKLFDIQDFQN